MGVIQNKIDISKSDPSEIAKLSTEVGNLEINQGEDYDDTMEYAVGDYCIHNGWLYVAIAETTGEWDSEAWSPTSITEELKKKGSGGGLDGYYMNVVGSKTSGGSYTQAIWVYDLPSPNKYKVLYSCDNGNVKITWNVGGVYGEEIIEDVEEGKIFDFDIPENTANVGVYAGGQGKTVVCALLKKFD